MTNTKGTNMGDSTATDPTVKVARDLREIEDLSALLLTQAIHSANDPTMPGGDALAALAYVASPEAWEYRYEAAESYGRDTTHILDESDDEPPLQTLLFWSEQLRTEHGNDYGLRPTIASETAYLRHMLTWMWENEPRWDDFRRDVRKSKRRLENVLRAGERVESGVPCMYDECRGRRLTRRLVRHGDVWEQSKWRCGNCKREWDDDAYARMVTAAHESTKYEDIDGVTWCSEDYAARDVGRSVKTIRTWVKDERVATACILSGKRARFVSLVDVREQNVKAKRRNRVA